MSTPNLDTKILKTLCGDGVAMTTEELLHRTNEPEADILQSCRELASCGYLFDQGPDLWDEDDEDFRNLWQLTNDGLAHAEAMRP